MDVVTVRWPEEQARRDALAAAGSPRVLLVSASAAAPAVADCLEDWVVLPASDEEIERRRAAVAARAVSHNGRAPELDDLGVLIYDGHDVTLTPMEASVLRPLVERFGRAVPRSVLMAAGGWTSPRRNTLDVHMVRIRREIEPLGLRIRTIRKRGYLLERLA